MDGYMYGWYIPGLATISSWTTPVREWANRLKEYFSAVCRFSFKKLIFISIIIWYYFYSKRNLLSCDMNQLQNRNFNMYYGIIDSNNHFKTTKVNECRETIIFRSVLPQMILNPDHSASSFMILAESGTGKTSLRCEYLKSLSSGKYLKVSILSEQITGYLDRFVGEMNGIKLSGNTHNSLVDWSENEFAQLLLSTLVTEFINSFDNWKHNGPELTLNEKINLITIGCYYYNREGTPQLEKWIKSFLNKALPSQYKVQNNHLKQDKSSDQQLFNHLQDDLNKFSILDKNNDRLGLLLNILKNEGFESEAGGKHRYGNTLRDLRQFSLYIKKYFKKMVVYVIDGIDDNHYFFQNNRINNASLQSFFRSSVSPSILGIVVAHEFHLSLFYPKIDGINIEDAILFKDKFPTHTITWNTKSLISYADYVLQEMNKKAAKTRCKAFSDFKTLVNYSNEKIAKIIDKIPTPRALHHFVTELMKEMNIEASTAEIPFQATFQNVESAYHASLKSFYRKIN